MNNFFDDLIVLKEEKNICLTGMTDEFFVFIYQNYSKKKIGIFY